VSKAKILHATKDAQGYHFLVHLDTDWTVKPHEAHDLALPEGNPHPQFVKRWDFGNLTPGVHQTFDKPATEDDEAVMRDMTEEEYLASIESMLREQIEIERQGMRFYQTAPPPHQIVKDLHGKEL
jgi:hypothetical protein